MDYILGDEGSGYSIGLKGLRAVMKTYDGRGKNTLLSGKILENLKLKNIQELMKWVYSKTPVKEKIAELGKVVCNTAELNDKISIRILKEESMEAVITIEAVIKKLRLEDKDFDLVLVGSVFKCKKYFKYVLYKKLNGKFPKINYKPLIKKPVEGAIRLAIENL